jgi:hypothetical protein
VEPMRGGAGASRGPAFAQGGHNACPESPLHWSRSSDMTKDIAARRQKHVSLEEVANGSGTSTSDRFKLRYCSSATCG